MFYFHLNVTLHTAMKLKFYEYLLFIFHIQQQQKIYLYIHIYAKLKYEDLTRSFGITGSQEENTIKAYFSFIYKIFISLHALKRIYKYF